jgi:hypothetical protein
MSTKTLIIYQAHDINDNLEFFCRNGYIEDLKYDFVIVLSNPMLKLKFAPKKDNIRVMNRERGGIDFGGWAHVLHSQDQATKKLYENYDYFVLLNSTVRGPFLPVWYDQSKHGYWPELFISKLNNEVKLVGSSINILGWPEQLSFPHVQSMLLVTDRVGLGIGIEGGFLSSNNISTNKGGIICGEDIGFSKAIVKAGYNIACMLPPYNNIDFRLPIPENLRGNSGDHYLENNYFGININPYEVIFYKASSRATLNVLNRYTEWSSRRPNVDKIVRVLYGISRGESVDVTQLIRGYLQGSPILSTKISVSKILGDLYIGKPKKLFIIFEDDEVEISEYYNRLQSNMILL